MEAVLRQREQMPAGAAARMRTTAIVGVIAVLVMSLVSLAVRMPVVRGVQDEPFGMLVLELPDDAAEFRAVASANPTSPEQQLDHDTWFILNYAALFVAIAALGWTTGRGGARAAAVASAALGVAAAYFDFRENGAIRAALAAVRSGALASDLSVDSIAAAAVWKWRCFFGAVLAGAFVFVGSRSRTDRALGLLCTAAACVGFATIGERPFLPLAFPLIGAGWLGFTARTIVSPGRVVDAFLGATSAAAAAARRARDQRPQDDDGSYPTPLAQRERDLVAARRRDAQSERAGETRETLGFALSGGGIRSATFALGVFQAIARLRLLRKIDLLSTVSGGGYFGSFFGRMFTRPEFGSAASVEDALAGAGNGPAVLRQLRENGRYLAPNGSGDLLLAGGALLRNWAAIHVVLVVFTLLLFLALHAVARALYLLAAPLSPTFVTWLDSKLTEPLRTSPWWLIAAVVTVVAAIPFGAAFFYRAWPLFLFGLASGIVLFFGIGAETGVWWAASVLTVVIASVVIHHQVVAGTSGAVDAERARRNQLSRGLRDALIVVAVLLGYGLVDTAGASFYAAIHAHGSAAAALKSWGAAVGAALVGVAGFGRTIATVINGKPEGKRPNRWVGAASTAGALAITFIVLAAVSLLSYAIAYRFEAPPGVHAAAVRPIDARVEVSTGGAATIDAHVELHADDPRVAAKETLTAPEPTLAREDGATWVPRDGAALGFGACGALGAGIALCLALSLAFRRWWAFLNDSSQFQFYGARLTRAYLGASNPARWRDDVPVTEVTKDDDLEIDRYHPERSGGPLHFINVTINETVHGRDQVQQQDRRGTGLAIGPEALSVGVRHHLLTGAAPVVFPPPGQFRVFEGARSAPHADLPLGSWLAVSGAAFSTGLGARTNLGLSLLCGLANVRLGYWWDPRDPSKPQPPDDPPPTLMRRFFPLQTYLLSEFVARFPGTAWDRWYLSDGGHFENMGGYELIRRRVKCIVVVDAECDGDSTFEGLGNLVRKARLDFGAEVHFLAADELDQSVHPALREHIGTLEQLKRGQWKAKPINAAGRVVETQRFEAADTAQFSLANAALATVSYADGTSGWLLYVKPTLLGNEPIDLLQYQSTSPDFPQETTADQFFDEAQWESYRRLGEWIAERLVTRRDPPAATAGTQNPDPFQPNDLFGRP